MPKIKLSEWAEKNNLSYITANRHFHAGIIPGAVQLDSGTILVEDTSELPMAANTSSNDAMSLFLKKTVEFSKNNSSVEDFAAFVISNFQLKLNSASEPSPRYSKMRPKSEEVQKHFQRFLPDKESVEHLKVVKTLLTKGQVAGDVVPSNLSAQAVKLQAVLDNTKPFERVSPISEYPADDFSSLISNNFETPPEVLSEDVSVHMYGTNPATEGLVSRSVDLNTTPQPINYTDSTSQPFSGSGSFTTGAAVAHPPFQPTQKELLSAAKVIETAETDDAPRKRGRKPTFKKT